MIVDEHDPDLPILRLPQTFDAVPVRGRPVERYECERTERAASSKASKSGVSPIS